MVRETAVPWRFLVASPRKTTSGRTYVPEPAAKTKESPGNNVVFSGFTDESVSLSVIKIIVEKMCGR